MFDTFATGMLLGIIVAAVENRSLLTPLSSFLMRLAGIGLLVATFLLHFSYSFVGVYFHTLSGIAFVLVLASTVLGVRHSIWERMLASFPIRFLGVISYSLYIWHEPIIIALTNRHILTFANPATFLYNTLAFISISILVAIISYWGIEYPAMHIRHLFSYKGHLLNRYKKILITPAK
jgi:peptidoglycan/LPS O-acetylase OafA/YrhL